MRERHPRSRPEYTAPPSGLSSYPLPFYPLSVPRHLIKVLELLSLNANGVPWAIVLNGVVKHEQNVVLKLLGRAVLEVGLFLLDGLDVHGALDDAVVVGDLR